VWKIDWKFVINFYIAILWAFMTEVVMSDWDLSCLQKRPVSSRNSKQRRAVSLLYDFIWQIILTTFRIYLEPFTLIVWGKKKAWTWWKISFAFKEYWHKEWVNDDRFFHFFGGWTVSLKRMNHCLFYDFPDQTNCAKGQGGSNQILRFIYCQKTQRFMKNA